MIEYSLRNNRNHTINSVAWTYTFPDIVPRPVDFESLTFRINGVVYTEWNEEFEKAVIWVKLQSS